MAPGDVDSTTYTGTYGLTQADIDYAEFNNSATASGLDPFDVPTVGVGTYSQSITQEASITISKTASPTELPEGESVTFTIEVENTGNVTLSDVTITDEEAPACDSVLEDDLLPGAVVSYDCVVDDVTTFTNVIVVVATPPTPASGVAPAPVTASAEAEVIGTPNSEIAFSRVWNDTNQNGKIDPGEKGIAGALLKLTFPDGSTLSTVTDANGYYTFGKLLAGTYTIEIVLGSIPVAAATDDIQLVTAGFFTIGNQDTTLLAASSGSTLKLTTPGSYTIILAAGEEVINVNFGVVSVLPVTGIDTTTIAFIAIALLLLGGGAVFFTTRKRDDDTDLAI
jgi:LPXTG-motif cell wall-anchored protein